MLGLVFGLIIFFAVFFTGLLGLGLIGGTVSILHTALTKPAAKEAAQVKNELLRCYRRDDFKSAEDMYRQLPPWEVTRQLRRTTTLHHQYHQRVSQASKFFNNDHGFALRLRESASLLPEYASLAGALVGLSCHVNGDFFRLQAESQQALSRRMQELQTTSERIASMQLEVQKSFAIRDPFTAQAVSDSLSRQFAELCAMNQVNDEYGRTNGV